jgi:hypothetical protein
VFNACLKINIKHSTLNTEIIMQRTLIVIGIVILLIGLAWPWLMKLHLFQLPGDIVIERENYKIYIPITSMIIVSIVLSLIFWLLRK